MRSTAYWPSVRVLAVICALTVTSVVARAEDPALRAPNAVPPATIPASQPTATATPTKVPAVLRPPLAY